MQYFKAVTSIYAIIFGLFFITSCDQGAREADDTEAQEDLELKEENFEVKPDYESTAIPKTVLEVRISDEYGNYLTDSTGRALYIFNIDSTLTSYCYDDCANIWPAYTINEGILPQSTVGVNDDFISTFTRRTGELQLAYRGQPLYYYVKDEDERQTQGHGIESFGSKWYLIDSEGEIIKSGAE